MSKTKDYLERTGFKGSFRCGDGRGLPRVPREERIKLCPGCGGHGDHPMKTEFSCPHCKGLGVLPLTEQEELERDREGMDEAINRLLGL